MLCTGEKTTAKSKNAEFLQKYVLTNIYQCPHPQMYENWKRKSVIGLNFDFLCLNVIGFTLYGLFNVGLYWIKPIQATNSRALRLSKACKL
jgi:hypothetical protein